jgi:GxxExxY protein
MSELKWREESYRIRGAIMEVHREMGSGFLEAVYQECLMREFTDRGAPFSAQPEQRLAYKGRNLLHRYRPDFVCYDRIVLEIKAVDTLADEHLAQLHNYLRATSLELGFLVNFSTHPKADIRRMVL